MKPLLLMPSGTLTPKEKSAIEAEGYLLIITDEPEKVKFITQEESLVGLNRDKLLSEALHCIYGASKDVDAMSLRDWFVRRILHDMGVKADKS